MNKTFCNDNSTTFQTTQCKQVNDNQIYFSYSNFPVSQSINVVDYNISTQNFTFQQNQSFTPPDQHDLSSWEYRTVPSEVNKSNKILDKAEMVEIHSKNLSYCTTMDLITSDNFKHINSDSTASNEWCNNENNFCKRIPEFSSCAQEKVNEYSNVQKYQDFDLATNYMFQEHTGKVINKTHSEVSSNYLCDGYNRFMKSQPYIHNTTYFNNNSCMDPIISSIYQQTEESSEDSDIIVEESDEDFTSYGQEVEKQSIYNTNRCLTCNMLYTPLGTQFFILTLKSPLTMSSQKPVIEKLETVIGKISATNNYIICGECLELINTIDHLQHKLQQNNTQLITRYEKTCSENNIPYKKQTLFKQKHRSTKFPKYKCKLCKKILCLKKYCIYHLKRHKSRGYLCDLCGKIYSQKKKFLIHRNLHKNNVPYSKIKGFLCSNCNKIFRTKSNKTEHENYCLGTLPYKCTHQYCDKKFSSCTKLKNHVRLKHDKKFTIICSICNIGFIKISDYKSHMVSHSTDKKYSCSKCDKSYKTLSNLNFHMKIHKEKLPFNCDICTKGFMRREYLEAHVNNHKGIKNFSCTYTQCGKKFVSQKNLDAHLKYHEGTVQKISCNICAEEISNGFEEHLQIHSCLKEFSCQYCDMKFNTKGAVSKHKKMKHADHIPKT